MTVVDHPDGLPGQLNVWRGRLLLLRSGGGPLAFVAGLALVYGVLVMLESGVLFAVGFTLAASAIALTGMFRRPGVRVSARSQPALAALVALLARPDDAVRPRPTAPAASTADQL